MNKNLEEERRLWDWIKDRWKVLALLQFLSEFYSSQQPPRDVEIMEIILF